MSNNTEVAGGSRHSLRHVLWALAYAVPTSLIAGLGNLAGGGDASIDELVRTGFVNHFPLAFLGNIVYARAISYLSRLPYHPYPTIAAPFVGGGAMYGYHALATTHNPFLTAVASTAAAGLVTVIQARRERKSISTPTNPPTA